MALSELVPINQIHLAKIVEFLSTTVFYFETLKKRWTFNKIVTYFKACVQALLISWISSVLFSFVSDNVA